MLKAVIFDLDGTLLNTLADLTAGVNYGLKTYGFPERTLDEIRSFIGNGVPTLVKRAAPFGTEPAIRQGIQEAFTNYYMEHMYDYTAPYDGITELLHTLKEAGLKTAIASNKLDEAVVKLNEIFFEGINDAAVGAPNDRKKPDPYVIDTALTRLGLDASEALYIGDTEVDLQTAANADINCVCAGWGFRTADELYAVGAKKVFESPREFGEYVLRNIE